MARVVSMEDRRMQDLAADLERHMAPQLHMGSVRRRCSEAHQRNHGPVGSLVLGVREQVPVSVERERSGRVPGPAAHL